MFVESANREPAAAASDIFLVFVLGLILGILGLGFGSWWQAQNRWERYVDRLRDIPGIVVTRSERQWGRYVIDGLRDPLAPDPQDFLEDAKIPEHKVSSHWEPYQALHPYFILTRIRHVLQPPQTVTLTLQNGTLIASGYATRAWIERARDLTRGFPGVEAWREDALSVIESGR